MFMKQPTHSATKSFTRGGQLFLHNFRMIKQVVVQFLFICFLIYLVFNLVWNIRYTTPYQRQLVGQWVLAQTLISLNENAKQNFTTDSGQTYEVYCRGVLTSPAIQAEIAKVSHQFYRGLTVSGSLLFISMLLITVWLTRRGQRQVEDTLLKGSSIVTPSELTQQLKSQEKASDITLAGVPIVKDSERSHFFIHGTTGAGKTVCIRELLDNVRQRKQRAIIYDKGGVYLPYFYRPGKDIILNPLDARTASWNIWAECRDSADYDSMAAALMPLPSGSYDPFWIIGARTIFAAAAYRMREHKDKNTLNLLKQLLVTDLNTISELLKGTEAETLVSEKIEKTALSVKTVLANNLKSLRYLKDDGELFSIRRWIQDDSSDSWLFITSRGDKHETLKPLISMWLDIAANALLSLPEDANRRIWMCLDELPSLHKLPYLPEAFSEARKFGGCLIAAMQSIAQLRKIYGDNGAEEITGLCNTRIFFRSTTTKTAEWSAKELGEAELKEMREGLSYGANTVRDGISLSEQTTTRPLILETEIKELNDLEAYIRLLGKWPITKVKFPFKERQACEPIFIERAFEIASLSQEVDNLIKQHEAPQPINSSKRPQYHDDLLEIN